MNMYKPRRNDYPGMPDPDMNDSRRYNRPGYPGSPTHPNRMGFYPSMEHDEERGNSRSNSPRMTPAPMYSEYDYEDDTPRRGKSHGQDPKDFRGVYAAINARQLSALMFHSDMADLFAFLGLMGFKEMHEYQYLCESACYRAVRNHYLAQYGKMLDEDDPTSVEVFPQEWYHYKRSEVTPEIRRQTVQIAMEQYLDWEEETKECYSRYASMLRSWGKTADSTKIRAMVKDVEEEIKRIEHLYKELKNSDFSLEHINATQTKLSRKYDNCYLGKEDFTL